MSAFNSHMQQNAFYRHLKWTFEDMLPRYCYAIKTSDGTIRTEVSQPASVGKWEDMSELQAHHCMTIAYWMWLLYSVSVIPEHKLSMQELITQSELSYWFQVF